jgi:hypothetical protein
MADIASVASGLESIINEAVQKAVNASQTTETQTNGQNVTQVTKSQTSSVNTAPSVATPEVPVSTAQGATPTDASSVEQPLAKTGNMQTGEYTNPYQQEQQGLVEQLGAAKTYETPPETQNFLKGIFKSQTEKFNYVAENDPLVKAARDNVEKAVMNMVNKRGFAFGSGTQDIISQQMAKVQPQFEDLARGEHADFLNRQLNLSGVIMNWEKMQFDRSKDQIALITTKLEFINKLEDRDFNIFKSMLEQRNINRTMYLENQKFQYQKKIQEQTTALNRLENMGYVDNEASIALGIPVGTKAKWALQMAMEQANKLELAAKENEYNLAKQQIDYQMEKELYALKDKLDLDSQLKLQAQTYQYKQDILAIEYARDVKLKQIAEEKAAREATEAAALKGAKASVSASNKETKALDSAYKSWSVKLMNKHLSGLKYNSQEAAAWLNELYKVGVDPLVIARLQATYGIPDYKPKAAKQTELQKTTAVRNTVYNATQGLLD